MVLDERWRWMRGGGGNTSLFTPVVSPDRGLAPRHRFFHFLRLCLISLLSVAGCDDWDGFQGSGTAQVISQE